MPQPLEQFAPSLNFALGELSPLFYGRSDLPAYRNGAAKLTNRRALTLGGTDTRPGLRYFADLPVYPAVLAAFVFSPDQRYVIAFSDSRADIWTWDGTPCTTLTGCPWPDSVLDELNWAQQFDTMIVCHRSFKTQRIFRTGATTFELSDMPLEVPAFDRFSDPDVKMSVAAIGAPGTTTTATLSHDICTDELFLNRQFRIEGYRFRCTQVTSATTINLEWISDTTDYTAPGDDYENAYGGSWGALFQATTIGTSTTTPSGAVNSFAWQEEAWQDTYGYPGVACFADGRLWLASSTDRPTTVWASKPGAYFNFDVGTGADGDAINDTMLGEGLGRIKHIVGAEKIIVLTQNNGCYVPESDQRPVTPSTIAFRPFARVGASDARPHMFDGAVLYAHRNGMVVNEVLWSDTLQTFQVNPLSLIASHLIAGPVQMAVLESTDTRQERLALVVNGDGTLTQLHSLRSEQVAAWMPWVTDGLFKSAAGVDTTGFVIVARDGSYFLEVFDDDVPPIDCCMEATSGTATRSFSGFTHLAGRTVAVVTNGHDLGDLDVDGSGNITLSSSMPEVTSIYAGLRFDQEIKTLPMTVDTPTGNSRTRKKRMIRAHVLVHEAGMFKIGGKTVLMANAGDSYDEEPPTYTGFVESPQFQVDLDAQISITDAGAYKFPVLGIVREVMING